MRTITNNANLPAPAFNALASDTYVGGGDISVTRIIAPPRIVALTKFHEDEIKEDAADRVWSLLGSSVHRMLELAASNKSVVEKRLFAEIAGWKISGQPDLYEPDIKALYDYKVTSAWAVLFGDKPEWERQVNLQAMLHRLNGDEVHSGSIVAIMRDWQVRKAKYEKDYPPEAIKVMPQVMWAQSDALDYATRRIKIHQRVQKEYEQSGFDPDVLPLCTDEERWYRGGGFAVKKMDASGKINKKADRVLPTEEEAKVFMEANKLTLPKKKVWAPIEVRQGVNIRCEDYCVVNFKCPFYQKILQEKTGAVMGDDEED